MSHKRRLQLAAQGPQGARFNNLTGPGIRCWHHFGWVLGRTIEKTMGILSCMIAKSKICDLINISAQCSTYALDFTPDPAWFNGDSASIVGQCECPENMDWDDWEMTCYVSISYWSDKKHHINAVNICTATFADEFLIVRSQQ